jgi:hypothetical protein
MSPSARLAATLLASLLLAYPALGAAVDGRMALEMGILRWGAALAVAWIAFGVLGSLVRSYKVAAETAEAEAVAAAQAEADRRRGDGPLPAG